MANHAAHFHQFLRHQTERDWANLVERLVPHIHAVDQTATRIWFHSFPLGLASAFEDTPDPAPLVRTLELMGRYRLHDQIDSSHAFLYGHRYWPTVKQVTLERAAEGPELADLMDAASEIGQRAADRAGVELAILFGIGAVALMTFRQVGPEAFGASPGHAALAPTAPRRSPDRVLSARARDDSQGLFGFLRGPRKRWTITFDERRTDARFPLIHEQTLTGAAASDKRNYHSQEPRCIVAEGPIPVRCRSAFCGTCWIGVLGGADKLSDVEDLERTRIREFGYIDTDDPKPIIRLACQSVATGAVSIVIPPWNGIVGRYLRARQTGGASAVSVPRWTFTTGC